MERKLLCQWYTAQALLLMLCFAWCQVWLIRMGMSQPLQRCCALWLIFVWSVVLSTNNNLWIWAWSSMVFCYLLASGMSTRVDGYQHMSVVAYFNNPKEISQCIDIKQRWSIQRCYFELTRLVIRSWVWCLKLMACSVPFSRVDWCSKGCVPSAPSQSPEI